MKSLAWQTRKQPHFASMGQAGKPKTPRRVGFELRDATGAVLASCEDLDPLCRWLGEKRDCVVVRVRDGAVIDRSPVSEAKESA